MPQQLPSLMHAAVALGGLALALYVLLTIQGVMAKAKGELSDAYAKDKSGPQPQGSIVNTGRNLINMFEFPVLFYALVAFHLAGGVVVDNLQLMLGWGFVASRFVHTAIHITINHVGLRFLAHRIGVIVLIVMWVRFALAL